MARRVTTWPWRPDLRAGLMAGQAAATAATRAALAALDAASAPGAWPAMEAGGERAALAALDRPGAAFRAWAAAGDGQAESRAAVAERALQGLHDAAWSRLHAPHRQAEPQVADSDAASNAGSLRPWREGFALCTLMRCALAAAGGRALAPAEAMTEALRLADLGLIMNNTAGDTIRVAPALFAAAEALAAALAADAAEAAGADGAAAEATAPPAKRQRAGPYRPVGAPEELPLVGTRDPSPPIRCPVAELARGQPLGLEAFIVRHLTASEPLLLRGGCADSPAVERWGR